MIKIFDTFPNLSNWEIYYSLIFKFPHIFQVFATVFILALTVLLVVTTFWNVSKKDQNVGKDEIGPITVLCLMSAVMIYNQFEFPKMVKEDERGGIMEMALGFKGEEEFLRIEKMKDWYVEAAPLIDQELTVKEYTCVDYELVKYEKLTKKQEIYLDSIGFSSPSVVNLTILNSEKEIETIKAFVHVEENDDVKVKGKIKLKYTSEFGEDLDLGKGMYYGTLYLK